jgi:hypothetical protein
LYLNFICISLKLITPTSFVCYLCFGYLEEMRAAASNAEKNLGGGLQECSDHGDELVDRPPMVPMYHIFPYAVYMPGDVEIIQLVDCPCTFVILLIFC